MINHSSISQGQLQEYISISNPITPLYNFIIISEGSCSICGKLDHMSKKMSNEGLVNPTIC